jgi:surface polysaccharide O-acyltransferase-like enzyme
MEKYFIMLVIALIIPFIEIKRRNYTRAIFIFVVIILIYFSVISNYMQELQHLKKQQEINKMLGNQFVIKDRE